MKQFLKGLALVGAVAVLVAGCSDDSINPNPTPQPKDTNYVEFKANDKFTYHYYPRDVNNNRDNSGKLVKVWTVVKVDQTIAERNKVAVVQEMTFEADGVTPLGVADTFYFHANSDGEFSQYDLLRAVVKRIPGAESFLQDVEGKWVRIGNTKATSATSWVAIEGGQVDNLITILGFPTAVTLSINAQHAGKQSITVPSGTYANNFHTDHRVIIGVDSEGLSIHAKDTLRLSYDITAKEGIVKQSLDSKTFTATSQQIPGFEMELVSVTRAQ